MAWNEPGGKKPNDPWNSNKNQGPPDLDELLKKLTGKLGGSNNGGSGLPGAPVLILIILILGGVFVLSGIYTVEQAERAVVLQFGKYSHEETAGLKWRIPLVQQVMKVDVEEIQGYDHKAHMITEDQNIVDVSLNVQYRVNNARDYFLAIEDPINSLHHATSSALRHVVGGESMDSVITDGRQKVAADVRVRLQEYLDSYKSGIYVTKVSIENTQPPVEVKDAFDDVIKAKEDKDRYINEAEAYRNQIIPEARGQRQRQIEEANAYKGEMIAEAEGDTERFNQILTEYKKAPDVTRNRLYIETMEKVYGDNPKVMIDSQDKNSLLYLPVEQLMKSQKTMEPSDSNEIVRPSRVQNRGFVAPTEQQVQSERARSLREGR
ncbi:MAG TPA: FtsH protease activity modulator HflK [Gammaproteobacteria bacterium]|nr:FtsH protease activity modulator HflK [Gammaproteobacteria bacterium]MEC8010578.1 FtsH protease activity modulator HflK [Pseudomonadota bacterium]HBF08719.1 FtsH protease activity modulator HflK [Gammaproteobacteria bacterium]HCK93326.1 FtsH protease activity modulator HflK [Gammaproteobacteria bacterium]|tara:strand:- start:2793 stop:3926 length:1134 start_codon:yes stop_codon:yes gene_type:complete